MHILVVILSLLKKMLLPALAGAAAVWVLRPVRKKRLEARGWITTPGHEAALTLFSAFLAGLFFLAVQPLNPLDGALHYNLVPFRIFHDVAQELRGGSALGFWTSFLGNFIMFMPLGFFPALLWRKVSWRHALLTGLLCSLTIELCQLPLGRSTDVDDLWMNTLGAGLGYGAYRALLGMKPNWCNLCKVKSKTEEEPS